MTTYGTLLANLFPDCTEEYTIYFPIKGKLDQNEDFKKIKIPLFENFMKCIKKFYFKDYSESHVEINKNNSDQNISLKFMIFGKNIKNGIKQYKQLKMKQYIDKLDQKQNIESV